MLRLSVVLFCFYSGLSFVALVLKPCNVFQNEAFFREWWPYFTEGHVGTKARKCLEFDCEDGGATGTVESASSCRRKSSWNSERNYAKKSPRESREAKEEKTEMSEGLDQLQRNFQPPVLVARFYSAQRYSFLFVLNPSEKQNLRSPNRTVPSCSLSRPR